MPDISLKRSKRSIATQALSTAVYSPFWTSDVFASLSTLAIAWFLYTMNIGFGFVAGAIGIVFVRRIAGKKIAPTVTVPAETVRPIKDFFRKEGAKVAPDQDDLV